MNVLKHFLQVSHFTQATKTCHEIITYLSSDAFASSENIGYMNMKPNKA